MKNLFYSVIALLAFASCESEYQTDIDIPMSGISLNSPADGSSMDLNENADSYEFKWDKASDNGSVVIFSTTRDLVKQVAVDAGSGTSFSLTALDFNQLLSQLDIKSGAEKLIYWTVKEKNNQEAAASDVHTLQVCRIRTMLLAPEDMSTATLLAGAPQSTIKFEWDTSKLEGDSECSILLSTDPSISNAVELPTKGIGNVTVTHEEMEQAIEQLPIKRYNTNTIYWNVRDNKTGSMVSLFASALFTNDMMRLVDKRGDETRVYPVVRVNFSDGTSQVWLAENLKTTRYPDGKEIESDYIKFAPQSLGQDWVDAIGPYYSFVIRDRIIPEGWRLPSNAEWHFLFSEAAKAGGYDLLKDPVYYYPDPSGHTRLNEWGLSFVSAGSWNLDQDAVILTQEKFYFMTSDNGDPASWSDPWRALIHDGGETLWLSWSKGTVMRYIYNED